MNVPDPLVILPAVGRIAFEALRLTAVTLLSAVVLACAGIGFVLSASSAGLVVVSQLAARLSRRLTN